MRRVGFRFVFIAVAGGAGLVPDACRAQTSYPMTTQGRADGRDPRPDGRGSHLGPGELRRRPGHCCARGRGCMAKS